MAIIDTERNAVVVRVVYDGPPLSGKTTCVQVLGQLLGKTSQVFSPKETLGRTLYFDWMEYIGGFFKGYSIACQIVSVPGHLPLRERRHALLRSADAVIFVMDSRRDSIADALRHLKDTQQALAGSDEPIRFLIQANKQDLANVYSAEELKQLFNYIPNVQVVESTAIDAKGVRESFVLGVRLAIERASLLQDKKKLMYGKPEIDSGEALLRMFEDSHASDFTDEEVAALSEHWTEEELALQTGKEIPLITLRPALVETEQTFEQLPALGELSLETTDDYALLEPTLLEAAQLDDGNISPLETLPNGFENLATDDLLLDTALPTLETENLTEDLTEDVTFLKEEDNDILPELGIENEETPLLESTLLEDALTVSEIEQLPELDELNNAEAANLTENIMASDSIEAIESEETRITTDESNALDPLDDAFLKTGQFSVSDFNTEIEKAALELDDTMQLSHPQKLEKLEQSVLQDTLELTEEIQLEELTENFSEEETAAFSANEQTAENLEAIILTDENVDNEQPLEEVPLPYLEQLAKSNSQAETLEQLADLGSLADLEECDSLTEFEEETEYLDEESLTELKHELLAQIAADALEEQENTEEELQAIAYLEQDSEVSNVEQLEHRAAQLTAQYETELTQTASAQQFLSGRALSSLSEHEFDEFTEELNHASEDLQTSEDIALSDIELSNLEQLENQETEFLAENFEETADITESVQLSTQETLFLAANPMGLMPQNEADEETLLAEDEVEVTELANAADELQETLEEISPVALEDEALELLADDLSTEAIEAAISEAIPETGEASNFAQLVTGTTADAAKENAVLSRLDKEIHDIAQQLPANAFSPTPHVAPPTSAKRLPVLPEEELKNEWVLPPFIGKKLLQDLLTHTVKSTHCHQGVWILQGQNGERCFSKIEWVFDDEVIAKQQLQKTISLQLRYSPVLSEKRSVFLSPERQGKLRLWQIVQLRATFAEDLQNALHWKTTEHQQFDYEVIASELFRCAIYFTDMQQRCERYGIRLPLALDKLGIDTHEQQVVYIGCLEENNSQPVMKIESSSPLLFNENFKHFVKQILTEHQADIALLLAALEQIPAFDEEILVVNQLIEEISLLA